jgi:GNAT superfamily N-acetyltransferase
VIIKTENFQPEQENEIYALIRKVYDEFVAPDYSDEGNKFFYNWIAPEKIAERQRVGRNMLVAMIDSKIAGVIETRDNSYVSLLFVLKEYQGLGIAKKLFHEALKNCQKTDPYIDKFYVHASPFSVPVYKKLGFAETDSMQEQNGIKYLPMEMKIVR